MSMGYRTLSRKSFQRKALLRDLITDLIINGRIETTEAKAKELKRLADKMVTLGKKGDLAARRSAAKLVRFEKAEEGYGMPDFVIDKVIDQCNEFIDDADNHFLIATFEERIKNVDTRNISKNDLIKTNTEKIKGPVIEGFKYIKNNLPKFAVVNAST